MRGSMLFPGGRVQAGRAGEDGYLKGTAHATKSFPEILVKPIPQAIITWPMGLDGPRVIFAQGRSELETLLIHELVERALG